MRLSVREHISDIRGTVGSIFTKFCTQIPCGRGSVLHWRRCDTLCISSFIDDVTFGRIGRDAETWRLHCAVTAMSGVAIQGRSLMSMNACCECINSVHTDETVDLYVVQEAIAEEQRMAARYVNDIDIAKSQRDYELKKAAYDQEVRTKTAQSDLAYALQVSFYILSIGR